MVSEERVSDIEPASMIDAGHRINQINYMSIVQSECVNIISTDLLKKEGRCREQLHVDLNIDRDSFRVVKLPKICTFSRCVTFLLYVFNTG